jgi:hypothetical protein
VTRLIQMSALGARLNVAGNLGPDKG